MMTRGRPTRETVYTRFATALDELARFGGLPQLRESGPIWHLEAHNSTAIEGNTLVLREVAALLEHRRAVGAKDLKDYLEVRHVHAQAMGRVWDVAPHPDANPHEGPGSFREHDIQPFAGGMTPPPWTDVPAQLHTWVERANTTKTGTDDGTLTPAAIPVTLAQLHSSFEAIHPFLDGNGRTGRLVLNLLLVRLGYPPAVIFKRDRDRYLRALGRSDHGDPGALAELIARSVIDNLHRFVAPNIAGPARLVPLRSLTRPDLTFEALRQAARRGRLAASQSSDGSWRSTQHDVETYLAIRHQRR